MHSDKNPWVRICTFCVVLYIIIRPIAFKNNILLESGRTKVLEYRWQTFWPFQQCMDAITCIKIGILSDHALLFYWFPRCVFYSYQKCCRGHRGQYQFPGGIADSGGSRQKMWYAASQLSHRSILSVAFICRHWRHCSSVSNWPTGVFGGTSVIHCSKNRQNTAVIKTNESLIIKI